MANVASELCGFVVVLSGTFLLHVTKDMGKCPSFRGALHKFLNALSRVEVYLQLQLRSFLQVTLFFNVSLLLILQVLIHPYLLHYQPDYVLQTLNHQSTKKRMMSHARRKSA